MFLNFILLSYFLLKEIIHLLWNYKTKRYRFMRYIFINFISLLFPLVLIVFYKYYDLLLLNNNIYVCFLIIFFLMLYFFKILKIRSRNKKDTLYVRIFKFILITIYLLWCHYQIFFVSIAITNYVIIFGVMGPATYEDLLDLFRNFNLNIFYTLPKNQEDWTRLGSILFVIYFIIVIFISSIDPNFFNKLFKK
jgi:hypothetical protein